MLRNPAAKRAPTARTGYLRDKPHAPKNIWYAQKQRISFSQPETCPQQGYSTVGMSFLLTNRDRIQSEQHSSAAETAHVHTNAALMLTQQQPLGTLWFNIQRRGKGGTGLLENALMQV